jgi:hypothetical protein
MLLVMEQRSERKTDRNAEEPFAGTWRGKSAAPGKDSSFAYLSVRYSGFTRLFFVPVVCPLNDFFLLVTVPLLYSPEELVVVPFCLRDVVVSQFPPLTLCLSFELLPLPFELFGIHHSLLLVV